MNITLHPYLRARDYSRVGEFLVRIYQPGNADGNWLQPIWEYMHFHPMLDESALERIGVWEAGGQIAAVAHYEDRPGTAFFEIDPAFLHLRPEMLDYAEVQLSAPDADGRLALRVYANDNDPQFGELLSQRGYRREGENTRPMYRFDVPQPFPAVTVPPGFRVMSFADECDWRKIDRVMWRGFNHPGEPASTEEDLQSRQHMFDTPTASRELKIVVEAPSGAFAAICGMFYEPCNRYALVEPVATDPDYRRLGLGKAAVLEGIRRCALRGATVAYVGSDQAFYKAIGFRKVFDSESWWKTL